MTVEDFNEKYKEFLEDGHYGLSIDNQEIIEWLDKEFQEFVKQEGFKYKQIKIKFRFGRFYCKGLTEEQIDRVENEITSLWNISLKENYE